MILILLFSISMLLLLGTWVLYPLSLYLYTRATSGTTFATGDYRGDEVDGCAVRITVILAVHNEEKVIVERLKNLIEAKRKCPNVDILVVSDHSTDLTCELVNGFGESFVTLVESSGDRGKCGAINYALGFADGEILVFTDAETNFEENFLAEIVKPFSNPKVGLVTGKLLWKKRQDSDVEEQLSVYWKYELFLRGLESRLGIKATSTGACFAVRKCLYRPVHVSCDPDFVTPLDVIKSGYLCRQQLSAIAYDYVGGDTTDEFGARVRMTTKNFANTIKHWGIDGWLHYPGVTIGLLFHKLFRWLTPFFFIVLFLISFTSVLSGGNVVLMFTFYMILLYLLFSLVGFVYPHVKYCRYCYIFFVVNVAFFLGVLNSLFGNVPTHFSKVGRV